MIHGDSGISLDLYDKRNGRIKEDITFSGSVQEVFPDGSFGRSKAHRFTVALVESDGGPFLFDQLLLLFHLNTRSKLKMSGELAFVRYFQIMPSIDNVHRVFHCLCFRWATDDETDYSLCECVSAADCIEVGGRYGVARFSSERSVLHIVG